MPLDVKSNDQPLGIGLGQKNFHPSQFQPKTGYVTSILWYFKYKS